MISLVVNSKCNQKCEYCFAYDTLHDNDKFMSLETCEEILKFQSKAKYFALKDCVGIIGGEPTLHPQFEEILKLFDEYSKRYFFNTILFTNGTHLLDHKIPDRMNLVGLINVNHPDMVGINNFNNTCKAIEKYACGFNAFSIGVNIYPLLKNYDFIFDICKRYNIDAIRTAVTCPDGKLKSMQNNKNKYFQSCIDIFIDFCKKAIDENIKINMDCCAIPLCYFDKTQKEIIKKACGFYPNLHENITLCIPHIDIHPDLTATHCFMRPEIISIKDFKIPDDLYDYINNNWIIPLHNNMKYGKCNNCNMFNDNKCQGGCLRFAKGDT